MGKASRSKGSRGESAAKRLFEERDYMVLPTPHGAHGDDFKIVKDGTVASVEVKNTCSLLLSMFLQAKRNAGELTRVLAWHPSRWQMPGNLWVLFWWERGEKYGDVRVWRANA